MKRVGSAADVNEHREVRIDEIPVRGLKLIADVIQVKEIKKSQNRRNPRQGIETQRGRGRP